MALPKLRRSGGFPSSSPDAFDVGQCDGGYSFGYLVGKRFAGVIRSRVAGDTLLTQQLLPFAATPAGERLLAGLERCNRQKYPHYWDEMAGIAAGSGAPLLEIMLLNFRKEMQPFAGGGAPAIAAASDECSDVLLVDDSTAIAAHNEDAAAALLGHTYLLRASLPGGVSFTAYAYAGELPSCAFGFNSNGVAFTLNSVQPLTGEIVPGGVARNFVSRDLLEARSLDDALSRIRGADVSVGHSYNLIDVRARRIVNVETASRNRCSVLEAGATPFFHANMYRHLQVPQVQDESSMRRLSRASRFSVSSAEEALSLLGDTADEPFPVYMTGPKLHTLCTVLIDADARTVAIYNGNPKNKDVRVVLDMEEQ